MKKTFLMICIALMGLTARAQGEQRLNEPGMRWLNPVELLGLKGMHLNNTQRTYYQGDVNVEEIIRESGTPILGMKLRPLAAAAQVEELCRIMLQIEEGENTSLHVDYSSLNGVQGVPLHEKSFCLYPEEYYDVDYEFSYHWGGTLPEKNDDGEEVMMTISATSEVEIDITDFYLREHDDKGWAVGYVLDAEENVKCEWSDGDTNRGRWTYRNNDVRKPILTRYIYFTNSNQLILMISADASKMKFNLQKKEEEKYADYPWARVYFVVEEVMVYEDQLPPDNPGDNPGDDPDSPGNDPDDPGNDPDNPDDPNHPDPTDDSLLKLDTHADPVESVVINSVGALVSIAMGAGIANTVTSILSGGAGGGGGMPPTPPDLPDLPDTDGIEPDPKEPEPDPEDPDEPEQPEEPEEPEEPEQPKEDEDEKKENQGQEDWQDGKESEEQEEPDPNKFVPRRYPDQCKGRVTQQPDGDIIVKDPETGKETMHYYPNGDGTWFTNTTVGKPDQYVTQEEIEDRIRFEADHPDHMKYVADKAAEAQKQQHEDLEKYIEDAKKNGYTDEEYHQWKQKWEADEKHQDTLNQLAWKYGIADSSDEKAIKKAIKTPLIQEAVAKAKHDQKVAAFADMWVSVGLVPFDYVDKSCETAVYGLGAALGAKGRYIRDSYIFLRATGQASVEACYMKDGKVVHVLASGQKAVNTIIFQTNLKTSADLLKLDEGGKFLFYVGSEGCNKSLDAIEKGKAPGGMVLEAMGNKALAYGISKGVGASNLMPTLADKYLTKLPSGDYALMGKELSKADVVAGGAAAISKGVMNAKAFVTETVPDAWGAIKRFKQALED